MIAMFWFSVIVLSATKTTTLTLTTTSTETLSLPTRSATVSLSLPTRSQTYSSSLSKSESKTISFSKSLSQTPFEFTEGQEFRIRVVAILEDSDHSDERIQFRTFNTTWDAKSPPQLETRLYKFNESDTDCNSQHYLSNKDVLLDSKSYFGISESDRSNGVGKSLGAYVTFSAPHSSEKFIICYKQRIQSKAYKFDSGGEWFLFRSELQSNQFVFQSKPTTLRYYIPDETVLQYAIVELRSEEFWNFTYSSSKCRVSMKECLQGDSFKIVPRGTSCTSERLSYSSQPYLGSRFVSIEGAWDYPAVSGLFEGSTVGGVGLFGTQFSNPITSDWSSFGEYEPLNSSIASITSVKRAYVYIQLPGPLPGDYEICFSARNLRRDIVPLNDTTGIEMLPVWSKLFGYQKDCSSCGTASSYFRVVKESITWSVNDLTPNTWGEIVFGDGEQYKLSTIPHNDEAKNHWNPLGGDTFRLVSDSYFPSSFVSTDVGTFPTKGCWNEPVGRYIDDKALYPIASKDLTSDPSNKTSVLEWSDTAGVPTAFSSLWIPGDTTTWYVCYRRTCNGNPSSGCHQNSGWRLIPVFKPLQDGPEISSSTPIRDPSLLKWRSPSVYINTTTLSDNDLILIPSYDTYSKQHQRLRAPLKVSWYMNDTREGTWGPLIIEKINTSVSGDLDQRKWSFYDEENDMGMVVGSSVRLVPVTHPCDYSEMGTHGTDTNSIDGGVVECYNNKAGNRNQCPGSLADGSNVDSVAFYITVPFVGSYRVCYRQGSLNWIEVGPSYHIPWVVNPQPDSILRRMDWKSERYLQVEPSPHLSLALDFDDDRENMQVLFIVSDVNGMLTSAPRTHTDTGDILRLVSQSQKCDINYNNYNKDHIASHMYRFCNSASDELCSKFMTSLKYQLIVPVLDENRYYGQSKLAGAIRIPSYNRSSIWNGIHNDYQLCFKQVEKSNWVLFNTTTVKPRNSNIAISPSAETMLVAGHYQKFSLTWLDDIRINNEWSTALENNGFYVKLIQRHRNDNKNNHFENEDSCFRPPSGTESQSYASSTVIVSSPSDGILEFSMQTPHEPGAYLICFKIGHRNSWYTPGTKHIFTVIDSGLRWYVTAGSQPKNTGVTTVNLVRCQNMLLKSSDKMLGSSREPCDLGIYGFESNSKIKKIDETLVFMTSPNEDRAKIVAMNDPCGEDSKHVGVWNSVGITDLEPGDTVSHTAWFKSTLPVQKHDERVIYKICVFTYLHMYSSSRMWVEVQQGTNIENQVMVFKYGTSKKVFETLPGRVQHWNLASELTPIFSRVKTRLLNGTAIAGASTVFVKNSRSTNPSSDGHGLTLTGINLNIPTVNQGGLPIGQNALFKIIPFKITTSSSTIEDPTTWLELHSDCETDSGAIAASNVHSCEGIHCPGLRYNNHRRDTIVVEAQLPTITGEYLICFKINHTDLVEPEPWQWLPASDGTYSLIVHPSYLRGEVMFHDSNISVFDISATPHVNGNISEGMSSWCGNELESKGTSCGDVGYRYDLFTVVNHSNICPVPQTAPLGLPAVPGGLPNSTFWWWILQRTKNVTTSISLQQTAAPAFAMPPPIKSDAGQYRLCVYKAGDFSHFNSTAVTRSGITYQLPIINRNGALEEFWTDSGIEPAALKVTNDIQFNSSYRFIEYDSSIGIMYHQSVVPTEVIREDNGQVSRTPLVRSTETVRFSIKPITANGEIITSGSYSVLVETCATPQTIDDLYCTLSYPADSGRIHLSGYNIVNIGGVKECHDNSSDIYNWPRHGLQQQLSNGKISFHLQIRSICSNESFSREYGCGFRFSAERVIKGQTDSNGNPLTEKIFSPPQWINILEIKPEEIDIIVQGSLTSRECYHRTLCHVELLSIYHQVRDYAPSGVVRINQIKPQIGANDTKQFSELIPDSTGSWGLGGLYVFDFNPILNTEIVNEGVVDFNISLIDNSSDGYVFFSKILTIKVTHGLISTLKPTLLMPIDAIQRQLLGTSESQTPLFYRLPADGGVNNFTALPGCYLAALVPYVLYYKPVLKNGVTVSEATSLSQWQIVSSIVNPLTGNVESRNRVLGVLFKEDSSLMSKVNLMTTPVSITTPLSSKPNFEYLTGSQWSGWRIVFRLFNSIGCSRFQLGGGCQINFTFKLRTAAGSNTVAEANMFITTPVRVPGNSIRLLTATGKTTTVFESTLRQGITIYAEPGRSCGIDCWMSDEFHHGSIFALPYDKTTGGALSYLGFSFLTDRLMGSDEVGCAYFDSETSECVVPKYIIKQQTISSKKLWAASWTLRTTKPCYNCDITFHSDIGAGPDSFGDSKSQTGLVNITLVDEDMEILCSVNSNPSFYTTESVTQPFTISVKAVKRGSELQIVHPTWWVYLESSTLTLDSYSIKQQGSVTGSVLRSKMSGGIAVFERLVLHSHNIISPFQPPLSSVKFHAIENHNSRVYTCSVDLKPVGTELGTSVAMKVSLQDATQIKTSNTSDSFWAVGISKMREGITIKADFFKIIGNIETTDATIRNITIIPRGGVASRPYGSSPTWFRLADSSTFSSEIVLDSEFNTESQLKIGQFSYTYGKAFLSLSRESTAPSAIIISYSTSVHPPVRAASFDVCMTTYVGQKEIVTETCTALRLWIVTDNPPDRHVVITKSPVGGKKNRGSGGTCGASPTEMNLEVLTYYEQPNTVEGFRYFSYDVPVQYEVRFTGQVFLKKGGVLANSTLRIHNRVPSDNIITILDQEMSLLHSVEYLTVISFHGRDVTDQNKPLSIEIGATNILRSQQVITAALTEQTYWWGQPTQLYSYFHLSNQITTDNECPSKRLFQSSNDFYKIYLPRPAVGWSYTDGVVQGIPFPIEASVRTVNGFRAWTFPSSSLRITKHTTSGCNDGGLLKRFILHPSSENELSSFRHGNISNFDEVVLPPIKYGSSVSWVTLSSPCERCVLRIDLCYVNRGVDNCLELPSVSSEDYYPLLFERTKLTKPFSVRKAIADKVVVTEQKLPSSDGDVIKVGDQFSVSIQEVASFAQGWEMTMPVGGLPNRMTVTISSEWSPNQNTILDSKHMRYGNGGFLSTKDAIACSVELPNTPSVVFSLSHLSEHTAKFHFTQPCSSCSVRISFDISNGVKSSFLLRQYDSRSPIMSSIGSVLKYRVMTCGYTWKLSQTHVHNVVRKRRPFSVTAVRVDQYGIPSWDTNEDATSMQQIPFLFLNRESVGNGAGGTLTITSAVEKQGFISGTGGSATVRLEVTRACYKCALQIGSATHYFSSTTDPTQVIAIPRYTEVDSSSQYTENIPHSWLFDIYTADELGDRSYLVGGPTYTGFVPLYHIRSRVVYGEQIFLKSHINFNLSAIGGLVSSGGASASLISGQFVYNGIPVPNRFIKELPLGTVGVTLIGKPVVGFNVAFGLPNFPDLPTRIIGSNTGPIINYWVPASHLTVDDPTLRGCKSPVIQGVPCTFRAYVVGELSNSTQNGDKIWYLSSQHLGTDDEVTASATCDSCVPKIYSVGMKSDKLIGIYSFNVTVSNFKSNTTGTCICQVVVSPPTEGVLRNVSTQVFSVSFSRRLLTQWKYAESENFFVTSHQRLRNTQTTRVAADRLVEIHLSAYDESGLVTNVGGLAWDASSSSKLIVDPSEMKPSGCFICENYESFVQNPPCLITLIANDKVSLKGYFTTPGECILSQNVISGLPQSKGDPTIMSTVMIVDVDKTDGFQLLLSNENSNFSGINGQTNKGDPAAIVGQQTTLSLEVLNSQSMRAIGDSHMVFTITAQQFVVDSNQNLTSEFILQQTSFKGIVTFSLQDPNYFTRSSKPYNPTHPSPWYFDIEAVATTARGESVEFGSILSVGPLYFIRSAKFVEVFAILGSNPPVRVTRRDEQSHGGPPPIPPLWMIGHSFKLFIKIVDYMRVTLDVGCRVSLIPGEIPCLNIDADIIPGVHRSLPGLYESCVEGGSCLPTSIKDMRPCNVLDWMVNGKTSASELELNVLPGMKSSLSAIYVGRPQVSKFLFTTTDLGDSLDHNSVGSIDFLSPDHLHVYYSGESAGELFVSNSSSCRSDTASNWVCHPPAVLNNIPTSNTTVEIWIGIITENERIIIPDNVSRITMSSRCMTGAASFVGKYDSEDSLDIISQLSVDVRQGIAHFNDIGFSGGCSQMILSFACFSGITDTLGLCTSKMVETLPFNVPGEVVDIISLSSPLNGEMGLGTFTPSEFTKFVSGVAGSEFSKSMLQLLRTDIQIIAKCDLQYVCEVPTGQVFDLQSAKGTPLCWSFSNQTAERLVESQQLNNNTSSTVEAVGVFYVASSVESDPSVMLNRVRSVLVNDLSASSSLLRSSNPTIFQRANASQITISHIATPSPTAPPSTKSPPWWTPSPPTSIPFVLPPEAAHVPDEYIFVPYAADCCSRVICSSVLLIVALISSVV